MWISTLPICHGGSLTAGRSGSLAAAVVSSDSQGHGLIFGFPLFRPSLLLRMSFPPEATVVLPWFWSARGGMGCGLAGSSLGLPGEIVFSRGLSDFFLVDLVRSWFGLWRG
ncbi:poly(A)-binding protein 5 [Striga asiatica]|uniref:Poly(A)-binding protein 5 n=1 Tax=Striga asiatica TaxID=4170 RepID=A0A5A7P5E7_STRAF|nr:poly(A)-binding protein 5 [Striga asiatica]